MLISIEKIYINQQEMTLKTYVKKTNYIRYKVRDTEIKLTIPHVVMKQGGIPEYKNRMIKSLESKLKEIPKSPLKSNSEINSIQILGVLFKITRSEFSKSYLDVNNKTINIHHNQDETGFSRTLKRLTYQYTLKELITRVEQINNITIQGKISEITLKDNKSTWGYCTSHNKLNFSLNLLYQPLWVIDYVIIHELAHLIHKDHSKNFWSLVSMHYPQFKIAKSYLKQHGNSNRI